MVEHSIVNRGVAGSSPATAARAERSVDVARPIRTVAERFWTYISPEPNSGCWLWTSAVSAAGYGQIGGEGRRAPVLYAHRVSFEIHNGPIPEGMQVDHKCQMRCCVNPDHMQLLDAAAHQNVTMARLPEHFSTTRARERTHCKYGHEWTPENQYRAQSGYRGCIICKREYLRTWRKARNGARN